MQKDFQHKKLRVFLCHSSNDKALVRALYHRLANEGFIDPWLDEKKILPGQSWEHEIPKAVKGSDVVIICLSSDSVNRQGYIQKEIKYALDVALEKTEGTIFIIPLKLQKCNIPENLGIYQWVDYYGRSKNKNYKRLIFALEHTAKSLNIQISEESSQFDQAILGPHDILFEQAEMIEEMPDEEREKYVARLQEIKSFLIRTMISDQPIYVDLASQWLKFNDLKEVRQKKIGSGKIGGKAAGMILANRIVGEVSSDSKGCLHKPISYFIGSDVMYEFMQLNNLTSWIDQMHKKYSEEQVYKNYEKIKEAFSRGKLPEAITSQLRGVLQEFGKKPIIVRSSSLLEDSFTISFKCKYDSIFCPNQGTENENLNELTKAISKVYASCFNPDALIYHKHRGVMDYIAIMIQVLEGEKFDRYFMPHGAGIASSRNIYRWAPQIRREDGFVQLVWGLGTRAIKWVEDDYPRLIALSHPTLHPSQKNIGKYSQKNVDLIDLRENTFRTHKCEDVLSTKYFPIRLIAQVDLGEYFAPIRSNSVDINKLIITFDEFLKQTDFATRMRSILNDLEKYYRRPVDIEFTLMLNQEKYRSTVEITILQCRPQVYFEEIENIVPRDIIDGNIIFETHRMVPRGIVKNIHYVLFISPKEFFSLNQFERIELERTISNINSLLEDQTFICLGPGRWGTSSPDLGIHITYKDIFNSSALIEMSGEGMGVGTALEPSFGTHFFQDLVESQIFLLPLYLDDDDVRFNGSFFFQTRNCLLDFVTADKNISECLRLIKVADYKPDHHMNLVMNDDKEQAVAYLVNG